MYIKELVVGTHSRHLTKKHMHVWMRSFSTPLITPPKSKGFHHFFRKRDRSMAILHAYTSQVPFPLIWHALNDRFVSSSKNLLVCIMTDLLCLRISPIVLIKAITWITVPSSSYRSKWDYPLAYLVPTGSIKPHRGEVESDSMPRTSQKYTSWQIMKRVGMC